MSQLSSAQPGEDRNPQPDKKTVVIDDMDRFVWGAAAIGEIINKSKSQVHYLLSRGMIDADRIGSR